MAILHKELALRFIIIMVFIGMSVPDVRTSSCNVFLLGKLLKAGCSNRGFTTVPNDLPNVTQIMDLSNNLLTVLLNDSFSNYNNLLELDLNSNGISIIETGCFNPLKELEILRIENNRIRNISSIIVPEMFLYSTKLHRIEIRRNMKESKSFQSQFVYPGNAFSVLTNLTHLYLDMVPNPVFGPGFQTLTNLQVLAFDYCFLASMTNGTFIYFAENLRELHLTHCHDVLGQKIQYGFLKPFKILMVLNLADTHIHLTRALKLLNVLANSEMDVINFQRVSYEQLDDDSLPYALTVTKDMMRYLKTICVKTLNLADNGIVDFRTDSLLTYDHPECFENIVFSTNRFTLHIGHKPREMLKLINGMRNVVLFDMSYNPIRFSDEIYLPIPNGDIPFDPVTTGCLGDHPRGNFGNNTIYLPPKLKILRFSHFIRESCGESVVLKNVSSLVSLDMSYFNFVKFPDLYIDGKNNLKILNFSGIDASKYTKKKIFPLFASVEEGYFRYAQLGKSYSSCKELLQIIPSVKVLDIAHNSIWSLPVDTFSTSQHLMELDISCNMLHEVPMAITNIKRLSKLNLRNNNLVTVNETITAWLDLVTSKNRNVTLLLDGNVFSCTCENRKFIRWIFTTKVQLDNSKNYSCRLPDGTLRNTVDVYKRYHDIFVDCNSGTWLRIGIALLVAFTVIALPTTIIFNFRWRIAYFFFRKFKTVVETKMNLKFSYDAYVSYADDAEDWVKNFLLYKAERKWGLSLCIDDRDLLAGQAYTDIISDSISASRQIIFVLTPEFLHREWNSFEIQRTKYEKAHHHLQVTIININAKADDIPTAFSSIWHDICVIEWSGNPYSWNSTEWDKLKLRLLLNR